jgi:hypothetical protein
MKKKVQIISVVWVVACLYALLTFSACTTPDAHATGTDALLHNNDLWNRRAADTAISMLKSGYLVLRTGLGAESYMFAQMNRKDKTYSHCGIVMIENGYPFVYHSIGGEDNPDERLRRDSAVFFFSPVHNISLAVVRYDLNESQINSLRSVVSGFYRARPKFDMKFDLATGDKLYCTEFVYKAYTIATNDKSFITPTTFLSKTFVGTDDLFVNPHASFICQKKYK